MSKKEAIHLKDYKPPFFYIEKTNLTFQIFDGHTDVIAVTKFIKNGEHKEPLVLDGEDIELLSITIDGEDPEYSETDGKLIINVDKSEFTLSIHNRIKPETNTSLSGLYKSADMYCTQCEAEGFRRITYFLDRPDVMASYTVRIEADKASYPILLSNGNPIDKGELDNGRHYVIWEDPFKKPSYLFALVTGDLETKQDTFTTMSGRNVELNIHVRKSDIDQTQWAMDSLKRCMKWDEERFGREYDLDLFNIVAVSDFNTGAMENKSLNIFNTQAVLAHPDLATDSDFFSVDRIIAHEYFHNWSGNRVTCRDWFQLSLKEGFTIFRDQEYSRDFYGKTNRRIEDVLTLREIQFPEDSGPMSHPVRPESYISIDNFYTLTVYYKGSEVIRMIHTLIGEKAFRKASDLYFDRFDGQAVTCDDFVDCMEEASGFDLSQFRLWYSQAGTPQLTCKGEYDPLGQTYTFTLYQNIPDTAGQTDKKDMHIPVQVGLLDKEGKDLIGTQTLYLHDSSQTFVFEGIEEEPASPSVLRNFSAPVQMDARLDRDQLAFLMSNDTDGFNRWESSQKLALSFILPGLYEMEKNGSVSTDDLLINAYGDLLNNEKDKALLSKSLTLPTEGYIAELRDSVDPLMIYALRDQYVTDIAKAHYDTFLEIYEENKLKGEYKPTPDDMASRALKNKALAYLMKQPEKAIDIAKAQYDDANNMTDRAIALRLLCDTDSNQKKEALDDFYNRYKEYDLVVNKWIAMQSTANNNDALNTIKSLREHEAFTIKNPNKVRALYGGFAMMNTLGFHAKDGSGYALMKDFLLELDGINPQITARLAAPLLKWRKLSSPYQENMRKALEDISANENLSPNTYEVVSKSLDA